MAKLTLIREKSIFLKKQEFIVLLNNQKVGTISNGTSADFDISPGQYKVTCETGWQNKSIGYQLNIDGNENKSVVVRPSSFANLVRILAGALVVLSCYYLKFKLNYTGKERYYYFAVLVLAALLILIPLRKYFIEIKDFQPVQK